MKIVLPFVLLCLAFCGCTKDKDEVLRIEGFLLRDQYGQPMGSSGNSDDDWQVTGWSSLSALEQGFLNFPDNINMENTVVGDVGDVMAFPNPVSQQSRMTLWAGETVKLKVALVNKEGVVLLSGASLVRGLSPLVFDVSDRSKFPSGASLRYYYSFSAAGAPHFKVGYGDIKICDAPTTGQCF